MTCSPLCPQNPMTPETIKRLFPNASKTFIKENETQADLYLEDLGQAPVVEPDPRPRSLAKGKAQGADTARFLVSVKSFRRRLLDEDNLCEKYHVDCLRYAGVIPDDTPDRTSIEVSQEKVSSKEHERIEITVHQTKG